MEGRSSPTGLVSFSDQVICLVDEGKVVGVIHLDFYGTILDKLAAHSLLRGTLLG